MLLFDPTYVLGSKFRLERNFFQGWSRIESRVVWKFHSIKRTVVNLGDLFCRLLECRGFPFLHLRDIEMLR
mgnify:CR=1 FL=1